MARQENSKVFSASLTPYKKGGAYLPPLSIIYLIRSALRSVVFLCWSSAIIFTESCFFLLVGSRIVLFVFCEAIREKRMSKSLNQFLFIPLLWPPRRDSHTRLRARSVFVSWPHRGLIYFRTWFESLFIPCKQKGPHLGGPGKSMCIIFVPPFAIQRYEKAIIVKSMLLMDRVQ